MTKVSADGSKWLYGGRRSSIWKTLMRFLLYLFASKNIFSIFKCLLLLSVTGILALYYFFVKGPSIIMDTSYGIVSDEEHISKVWIEWERCSEVTKNCFYVYDEVDLITKEVDRSLTTKDFKTEMETTVRLIAPPGMNSRYSDTRFWEVNHAFIKNQYVAAMLSIPFAFSSMKTSKNSNTDIKVLMIGLGGGSINMFLATQFPEVSITSVELDPMVVDLSKKWFDVKETKNNKLVISDGSKFISDAVQEGKKFDIVMLDVCGGDVSLSCPTKAFISSLVIKNVKNVLVETGLVIVNILPQKVSDEVADVVITAFQMHFNKCAVVTLRREMNVILVCAVNSENLNDKSVSAHFRKVWQYFPFNSQFGATELIFLEKKE